MTSLRQRECRRSRRSSRPRHSVSGRTGCRRPSRPRSSKPPWRAWSTKSSTAGTGCALPRIGLCEEPAKVISRLLIHRPGKPRHSSSGVVRKRAGFTSRCEVDPRSTAGFADDHYIRFPAGNACRSASRQVRQSVARRGSAPTSSAPASSMTSLAPVEIAAPVEAPPARAALSANLPPTPADTNDQLQVGRLGSAAARRSRQSRR